MLQHRCNTLDLSPFTELEERRRRILQDVEEKKARRNAVSKEVGARKKAGENADEIVAEMRTLGDEIAALDEDLRDVELRLRGLLLQIPNMPKADVPIGKDETENPEVRRCGTPRTFDFTPRRTGTSATHSASSMQSARRRSRAHALRSTRGSAHGLSAPALTS